MATLILFNKPYGVLSQFTDDKNRPTLAQYIDIPDVYPAGRLDHDSEGLLLLTDDGQLQHQIAHPTHKAAKTYWAQVEGTPTNDAITKLQQGIELNDGMTQPAEVRLITPPTLWERDPPIRVRAHIPTQWVEIVITEGRNRQVRRMTAAVGYPTLRLVRVKIGNWSLTGIDQGKYQVEQVKTAASIANKITKQKVQNSRYSRAPHKNQKMSNGAKTTSHSRAANKPGTARNATVKKQPKNNYHE